MQNLHKIMGAKFEHEKPNLCPFCIHRKEYGEWQGYCEAKGRILSAPRGGVKSPRCKEFSKVQP